MGRARDVVITIDGPAGAGKSTVAKRVADALGLAHLDTGAMYRAITAKALSTGTDIHDGPGLAALASRTAMGFTPEGLIVDGRPADAELRARRVDAAVSTVAAHPEVRREMVALQRAMLSRGSIVAEGRDIGTVVYPAAPLKIFLTASAPERARRRHMDVVAAGRTVAIEELQREIEQRDRQDSTRATSPLTPAKDAVLLDTTGKNVDEVVREIVSLAREVGEG